MKKIVRAMIICIIIFFLFIHLGDRTENNNYSHVILVTVNKGDTLWDIAEKHRSGKADIRKIISEIKKINNLNDEFIYPGQQLAIPVPNDNKDFLTWANKKL
ncbi:MAG: LysM peptidoglycan-binding domain-containing protein [Clostridia bacterium]|nr:LysM peptidoglycan-binding domain-containing protein [Clostridia bacterium]